MTAAPENAIHPLSRSEWRAWLEEDHARDEGVWLISYKKATGKPRLEYDEAVEEALCFDWIDSKPNKLDDERSMLWFAPRKAELSNIRTKERSLQGKTLRLCSSLSSWAQSAFWQA